MCERRRPLPIALTVLSGCAAAPPAVESTVPPPAAPPAEIAIAPVATVEPTGAPTVTAAPASAAPVAAGEYRLEVGHTTVKGVASAVLRVTAPCAGGRCERAPFVLGPVSVKTAGLVDLMGSTVRVQQQQDLFGGGGGGGGLPTSLSPTASFPAAVLVVEEPDEELVIVSFRDDPPVRILSVPLSRHMPGGGGFSTINSVELRQIGAEPLEVEFSQTSIPRPTDRPFRPGPPLHFRYRFDGTRYNRQ